MPIRAPILVGWAAGPSADQLVGRSKEYVVEKAIDSLQSIFSISRAELHDQLIGTYYYDWTTDPFSRGAYSYVSVGQLDKRKKLASPIDDTLFFAGEATDFTGNWATVHGAIATGKRAAREILEC